MVTDEWLRDFFIPRHSEIWGKRNVVGWSRSFKPKLREGEPPGEPCFRVYVSKKVDASALALKDLIPKEVDGILTDVVEVGEVRAVATNRRGVCRPVPLGVGIGNWDITQGSLGELYTRVGDPKVYAGSNAHIVAPNPFLPVGSIIEKRILQPGVFELGKNPSNVVGSYVWHRELVKMGSSTWNPINSFGELIWRIVQFILQILGMGSAPKSAAVDEFNLIDFGVYEPTTAHDAGVVDGVLGDEPFVGHLFAASEFIGIICKVEYIMAEGYVPNHEAVKVVEGDVVKGASFWGDYQTRVIDSNAEMMVNYGDFYARFRDIILVENDGTIRGGWSGSGFRLLS